MYLYIYIRRYVYSTARELSISEGAIVTILRERAPLLRRPPYLSPLFPSISLSLSLPFAHLLFPAPTIRLLSHSLSFSLPLRTTATSRASCRSCSRSWRRRIRSCTWAPTRRNPICLFGLTLAINTM